MKRITSQIALSLLTLLWTDDSALAQTVTVIRNVNLRVDSWTDQAPIRLLRPPTHLQLLQADEDDGFVNVRTEEGQEGWVWARNVRIESSPDPGLSTALTLTGEFRDDWEKPTPSGSAMTGPSGSCPFAGKGDEDQANRRKNRTDMPSEVHNVSFNALGIVTISEGAEASLAMDR